MMQLSLFVLGGSERSLASDEANLNGSGRERGDLWKKKKKKKKQQQQEEDGPVILCDDHFIPSAVKLHRRFHESTFFLSCPKQRKESEREQCALQHSSGKAVPTGVTEKRVLYL
ncbi:hypothetical protein C4D60_Mb02t17160 [Musa balbisiana]|uniref:Uncharacterized protein n=1 Tax=Musa balbisiana TaxID=52838 RepID=A0A4S8IBB0_MUSBA|nr:hypothetical protein C4D60_Mb02t17160 [Musa balbisiana]